MRVLILVDIQNDFLTGGSLAVPHGNEVVPIANALARRFETVVATQDWHPPDHESFQVNRPKGSDGWPVHCVHHTPGANLAPELDRARIARVFPKGTDSAVDSYSGFFDNDHKHSTGLHDYLQQIGATELYVMGLATDYCVRATVLDALDLKYPTWVIEDGIRGVELKNGDIDAAIAEMKRAGANFIKSQDVL